ncbi:hypothetical protein WH8501_09515 [Crocosphaera watsonii WH 8501]|uniref:Lipoprotein n=2 Tax=Crocosphaera TaxID=263510 RepID=Q4C8P4_CROWT|nr:hypothetical protein [Crocosphaera watsonii]EAM52227.1 hypothetical protein CwatDRAFT_5351 [Crocosphaera watsonii WH 8501]
MKLRIKQNIIQISSLLIIVFVVYSCEPHLFNMDDGPYYSEDYGGDIELLTLESQVKLSRLGIPTYILESYLLTPTESVIVLKNTQGEIIWQKIPIKFDVGKKRLLGTVKLRQRYTDLRLDGGWEVSIKPSCQEPGILYISPWGEFLFFYHSW